MVFCSIRLSNVLNGTPYSFKVLVISHSHDGGPKWQLAFASMK
jgi:hypothetical protein